MKKIAVAAAVAAVFSAALSAQQTATPRSVPTPSTAPKMAPSHPSAKAATGALSLTIDEQNKLVAQNCATCHSERMKAGELVLAGFDAAKLTDRPEVAEKMIR